METVVVDVDTFVSSWLHDTERLLAHLSEPAALVVKDYLPAGVVTALRDGCFGEAQLSEPSWQPLVDGCTDYHRVHDNYPDAHVKSRMHAWYFHGYCRTNSDLFGRFSDIFDLKWRLAGREGLPELDAQPSQGLVARVLVHHYPSGGGYQAEHVDPVFDLARVQTLVMGSEIGSDFTSGGLYARSHANGPATYLDNAASLGDLVLLSPGVQHGVAPVDDHVDGYHLGTNSGRWVIMPIFVPSDYPSANTARPAQVTAS